MLARILFLCLLLGVVSATPDMVPGAVWKGYFPGRSGDVIVEDKGVASHDSFLLFLSQPEYQDKVEMAGIDETNVADLLAHLLGLPSINIGLDRTAFPRVDYFSKPTANLLVVLDSSADPASFSLNGRRIEIRPEAYPNDPLARTYTMLSGSPPSHHGIIQRRWHNAIKNEVQAFSSWYPTTAGSPRGTLIDMMNLAYAGKSLLFAASSDPRVARALAAKPYTLTDANAHAIHWNAQKRLFESAYIDRTAPVAVTERVLQHFLASQVLVSEGQYNVEHNSFDMPLSDGTEVVFDLSGKEEAAFFRELALSQVLFQQLSESVAVSNLIKDRVPDFYSFAFTSVTALERKYRANPSAQVAIFRLLQTCIVKMHAEFSRVYGTDVLAEVAFFSSAAPERIDLIAETVGEALPSPLVLSDFAPQIYLTDVADRTQACHLAQSVLAPLGAKAYCMPAYSALESDALSAHSEAMRLVRRDNGSDDGPTSDDIAIFQIVLWTSVALILMTLGTYLCMTTLDASKDGILYNTITATHAKSS